MSERCLPHGNLLLNVVRHVEVLEDSHHIPGELDDGGQSASLPQK